MIFFTWAGQTMAHAFKLPSSSKLLVILSVAAAVIGIVMATRQGRRFAARKLLPPVRSSLASLRQVARSPAKLALLFGGSALVTLAYVGGLVASVEAFGGGRGHRRGGRGLPGRRRRRRRLSHPGRTGCLRDRGRSRA